MKCIAHLTEVDIRQIIADHFEVDPKKVSLRHTEEQQDGPHHSPDSVTATVDDVRIMPKGARS